MKQFYMTFDRELNIIRYSENSDQKDAIPVSYDEAKERLMKKNYWETESAESFLQYVMHNPFENWTTY